MSVRPTDAGAEPDSDAAGTEPPFDATKGFQGVEARWTDPGIPDDEALVRTGERMPRNGSRAPDTMTHPVVYARQFMAAWARASPQVRITMPIAAAMAYVATQVSHPAVVIPTVVGLSVIGLGGFWATVSTFRKARDAPHETREDAPGS